MFAHAHLQLLLAQQEAVILLTGVLVASERCVHPALWHLDAERNRISSLGALDWNRTRVALECRTAFPDFEPTVHDGGRSRGRILAEQPVLQALRTLEKARPELFPGDFEQGCKAHGRCTYRSCPKVTRMSSSGSLEPEESRMKRESLMSSSSSPSSCSAARSIQSLNRGGFAPSAARLPGIALQSVLWGRRMVKPVRRRRVTVPWSLRSVWIMYVSPRPGNRTRGWGLSPL